MDDKIVRTSVEENDSNIIKKQVMNKTDDSLIRHQVMGICGDVPTPVYTTLSVTENGTYTPTPGEEDAFNEVVVNVAIPGVLVDNAKIVKEIPTPTPPEVLPEGMLYIKPKGTQYCPPIPTVAGAPYAVICCDSVVTQPYSWMNHTRLTQATKYWLYLSADVGKCRRDAIQTLSWGDSTGNQPPEHAYVYDTSSQNFEWVELDTTDSQFVADFNKQATDSGAIIHNTLEVCYTNYNIFRYTVGSLEFDASLSILNSDCREFNVYDINEFDCYLVDDTNTAVYQATYTMKQLISNYR